MSEDLHVILDGSTSVIYVLPVWLMRSANGLSPEDWIAGVWRMDECWTVEWPGWKSMDRGLGPGCSSAMRSRRDVTRRSHLTTAVPKVGQWYSSARWAWCSYDRASKYHIEASLQRRRQRTRLRFKHANYLAG